VEHIARMGDMINAYSILVGKREGKRPLGGPRMNGSSGKRMGRCDTGCMWLGIETSGGSS